MICNTTFKALGSAFLGWLSGRENSVEPGCAIVGSGFFWWQRAGKSMMNETSGIPSAGNPRTMNTPRRSWKRATAGFGLGVLALADPALTADMPLKAPALKSVYDWTGFYVGAHAGFGRGSSSAVLTDPAASTTGNVFDGMIGGVQAGYNYRLASGFLLGVEADISLPSYLTSNSLVSSIATARSAVTEQ